ncbi:MAG: DGQHR domain-containing protein [Verrucomicrobiales bacterium]|nr:DGQHR domain-containing protein [Verrucomicrobiales bacterium]
MKTLTGTPLEEKGEDLFRLMNIDFASKLKQVRLKALDPTGHHGDDEHLEFDYLIPLGEVCLVGEITSRNRSNAKDKLPKFSTALNLCQKALNERTTVTQKDDFWKTIGVADSALLRKFRNVSDLKGFVILSEVDRTEGTLKSVTGVHVFYKYDWQVLWEYADTIGHYAKYPFLGATGCTLPPSGGGTSLKIYKESSGELLAACDKHTTEDTTHTAHVLTFLADPYDLLPIAHVWRRDLFPGASPNQSARYQRMLVSKKLKAIRKDLLSNPDFVFPNSILAVLSPDCSYSKSTKELSIKGTYGSLQIVDGQHRLYAYASDEVNTTMGTEGRILVTAVLYEDADDKYIQEISARTFIDINTNQTKVSSIHLACIGYQTLGKTDRKSIAAHVLTRLNERAGKMRGLLQTSDSPTGRIKLMEIVSSLGPIVCPVAVGKTRKEDTKSGYENLFDATVDELSDPDSMVEKAISALERFYGYVARTFPIDWPSPSGESINSALELSKFHAALLKLLKVFIDEGADWNTVNSELTKIATNIKKKRRISTKPEEIVLFTKNKAIPDARAKISDDLEFLKRNRSKGTSIQDID